MNTKKHEQEKIIFRDEVYAIVGCAMRVQRTLGPGLLEKVYENAFAVELAEAKIPFEQQKHFQVFYRKKLIGDYVADLLAYEKIIVELKTVEQITNIERAQTLNYMRIAQCPVGLIFNFRKTLLEWERLVL